MNIHEKINDWIVPCLLAFAVYYLQSMSTEMSKIGNTLSVALYRIDDQETRLKSLENTRLDASNGRRPN